MCLPGCTFCRLTVMNLPRCLLYLSYLLSFTLAAAGTPYEYDSDSLSDECELFSAEQMASLGQLIIDGDDPQAIARLLNDRSIRHSGEVQEHLHTMIQHGRTRSFEYLFGKCIQKGHEGMVQLIDLALQEHRAGICRAMLEYDAEYFAALLEDDDGYPISLTGFWRRRPFLWREAELEGLLRDFPDLACSICPPADRLFDDALDLEPTLLAIRLTLRYVEFYHYGQRYAPADFLAAALSSRLGDESMAQIIICIVEHGADVTEEMRDQFVQAHPEHPHSGLALGDALAAAKDAAHLQQLIAEGGDVPEAVATYLRDHPLRFARYAVDVLKAAIRAGRIGCFEALLPLVRDFPAAEYDAQMSHLFVQTVQEHQPVMSRMLLALGFRFDAGRAGAGLPRIWQESPFPWAEDELLGLIEEAHGFAHCFCLRLRRERWYSFDSARVVAMLIRVNHRYGAVHGKDHADPTAMLGALLYLDLPDEDLAGLVGQLVMLGADVTEETKAECVRARSNLYAQRLGERPRMAAVLGALDAVLDVPDIKQVAEDDEE